MTYMGNNRQLESCTTMDKLNGLVPEGVYILPHNIIIIKASTIVSYRIDKKGKLRHRPSFRQSHSHSCVSSTTNRNRHTNIQTHTHTYTNKVLISFHCVVCMIPSTLSNKTPRTRNICSDWCTVMDCPTLEWKVLHLANRGTVGTTQELFKVDLVVPRNNHDNISLSWFVMALVHTTQHNIVVQSSNESVFVVHCQPSNTDNLDFQSLAPRGCRIFDSRLLNRKFLLQNTDFQFDRRSRMYHTAVDLPITR